MSPDATTDTRHDGIDDDLAWAARFFAQRLGWPVRIDSAHQRLVMRTGEVLDALVLPRSLGEAVSTALDTKLLAGPVYRDDQDRWWTFLTAPCGHGTVVLRPDLRQARVHAVPPQGQLVVPPPSATDRWHQRPTVDRRLPPWSAVVAVTRSVVPASTHSTALDSGGRVR